MADKTHQKISIEEKIKIFEKYFSQSNVPVNATTIFEGYNLGMWQSNLRAQEENEKLPHALTDEMKQKLIDFGILSNRQRNKRTTDEQKIEIIEKFIEEHPNVEINGSTVDENGNTVGQYIAWLKVKYNREQRSGRQTMSSGVKKKLEENKFYEGEKRTSIKEVKDELGSSDKEAEYIIDKYGKSEGILKLIKEIREELSISLEDAVYLFDNYGSLDSIIKYYKQMDSIPVNEIIMFWKLKQSRSILTNSDLENPIIENTYLRLAKDIYRLEQKDEEIELDGKKYKALLIVDKSKLDEVINKLSEREQSVIRDYYGLNGDKILDAQQLKEKYKVSFERIRQIKEKAIRKLSALIKNKNVIFDNRIFTNLRKKDDELKKHIKILGRLKEQDIKSKAQQAGIPEKLIRAFYDVELRRIEEESAIIESSLQQSENELKVIYNNYYSDEYQIKINNLNKKFAMPQDLNLVDKLMPSFRLSEELLNKLKEWGVTSKTELLELLRKEDFLDKLTQQEIYDVVEYLGEEFNPLKLETKEEPKKSIDFSPKEATIMSQMLIEELNLTQRTFNLLKRAGINTLEDLENTLGGNITDINTNGLIKIKNLGKLAVEEIVEKVEKFVEEHKDEVMKYVSEVKEDKIKDNHEKINEVHFLTTLSTSVKNKLKRAGMGSFESLEKLAGGDIKKLTVEKLLTIDGLGVKSAEEIVEKVQSFVIAIEKQTEIERFSINIKMLNEFDNLLENALQESAEEKILEVKQKTRTKEIQDYLNK